MTRIWSGVAVSCLSAFLHVAISFADASTTPTLQSSEVLKDIDARGARVVAETLWNDEAGWKQVLSNVGQGRHGWLEVAAALRPGTDGGASETLDEAVFLALAPDPRGVLNLLEQGKFAGRFVCSGNIADDYGAAKAREFLRQRITVLSHISDSKLQAVRDECIANMRAAVKILSATPE